MSIMKKLLAVALTASISAGAAIAGTVAYLQDTESDVNVMTLGNVYIDQIEQEWNAGKTALQPFTQAKPLYPCVGAFGWKNTGTANGAYRQFTMNNVVDKYVSVENTGKSDAYVRTIIALEMGDLDISAFAEAISLSVNAEDGAEFDFSGAWNWTDDFVTAIDGKNYNIMVAVHKNPVKPGETTIPSLLQVYMKSAADNDTVEKIDGNGNGAFDILVVSQAVQAEGFSDAQTALDTAFGKTEDKAAEWFGGMTPEIFYSWEGVNYITAGDTAVASSAGGTVVYRNILSEGVAGVPNVVIGEGITRLNDRALCKDMNLKTVALPNSLTYIDEGVFQQSGFVSIEVPENVTYIGKTAFGACPDLETIIIKAKNVTFANYVARACANLKEVYIYSDSVDFESGSMYFTNKENGDASAITFYVKDQAMADKCYAAFSTSHSYGMLIKSLDGTTEFYNTLK